MARERRKGGLQSWQLDPLPTPISSCHPQPCLLPSPGFSLTPWQPLLVPLFLPQARHPPVALLSPGIYEVPAGTAPTPQISPSHTDVTTVCDINTDINTHTHTTTGWVTTFNFLPHIFQLLWSQRLV